MVDGGWRDRYSIVSRFRNNSGRARTAKKRLISNEELLVSNMLEVQAMIRILCKKGITTEDEIMQEIIKLKEEMEQKMRDAQKLN